MIRPSNKCSLSSGARMESDFRTLFRRWDRVLIPVELACVLLLSGSGRSQEDPQTYPVRGIVENSLTHQPVARALVEAGDQAVLTDGEGRFEMNLPESRLAIRVRRPGYAGEQAQGHLVGVGPNMPDLTLYLMPSAGVTGHVALSSGDSAGGLRFSAYRRRGQEGRYRWTHAGDAMTNSVGIFRFLQLEAPGFYVICTEGMRERYGAATPKAPVFGYPPVCAPGGDAALSNPLWIGKGQQADLEISLTRQRFYSVSVTMPNSSPNQGVSFQIADQNGLPMGGGARWNEQRSSWETELPDGIYRAEVRSGGERGFYGRVDFRLAGAPLTGLTVAVGQLHPIPVEIRKNFTAREPDSPITIAGAASPDEGPGMVISLTPADALFDNDGGGNLERRAGSSDTSQYEIRFWRPGAYWVRAFAFNGYISSMTSGGTDLMREPLVIGPGGQASPIQVTLRNDTGSIECRVNQPDAATGPGAAGGGSPLDAPAAVGEEKMIAVYAIPQFPLSSRTPQAVGEGSGRFQIDNLAPGAYRVVAVEHLEQQWSDNVPDAALRASKGQLVTVEPGATSHVVVEFNASGDEGE